MSEHLADLCDPQSPQGERIKPTPTFAPDFCVCVHEYVLACAHIPNLKHVKAKRQTPALFVLTLLLPEIQFSLPIVLGFPKANNEKYLYYCTVAIISSCQPSCDPNIAGLGTIIVVNSPPTPL